jgi:hypothetical protein
MKLSCHLIMRFLSKQKNIILFFVLSNVFLIGNSTGAVEPAGLLIRVSSDCVNRGNCTFMDLMKVVFEIADFIVGFIAILALVFLVVGGAMLLFSGGSQEYIDRGKRIIKASIIGVVLVLTAWIIVNFMVVALTGSKTGTIFEDTPWAQIITRP